MYRYIYDQLKDCPWLKGGRTNRETKLKSSSAWSGTSSVPMMAPVSRQKKTVTGGRSKKTSLHESKKSGFIHQNNFSISTLPNAFRPLHAALYLRAEGRGVFGLWWFRMIFGVNHANDGNDASGAVASPCWLMFFGKSAEMSSHFDGERVVPDKWGKIPTVFQYGSWEALASTHVGCL